MKIAVGCDPNAAEFKKQIIPVIESFGHEVEDFGSDDTIYTNVAVRVGEAIISKKFDRGILICDTDIYQAQFSNNANVITLGAFVTGIEPAKCLIK